jgi:peptidoglycan/xylan/chitin deacetylase (PgdA/CDA1 family)
MGIIRRAMRFAAPAIVDWSPLRRRVLFRRTDAAPAVALTFDDGPDPDHTPALLDLLAEHRVRATFFLVGHRAGQHGGLIRRIAGEGHAIGNHSYSHVKCSTLPLARVLDELDRTDKVIRDAGVQPTSLFRPPWGRLTAVQTWRLLREGRRLVYWSLKSDDHLLDPAEITARCARARRRDIVLLHDSNPNTRAALPDILKALAGAGLTPLPLADPAAVPPAGPASQTATAEPGAVADRV